MSLNYKDIIMSKINTLKALGMSTLAATVFLAAQPLANAYDLNTISSVPITVHGFATAAGGSNNSNQSYMHVNGREGNTHPNFTLDNSLVGLQVAAQLSQKLSFTTQMVGSYNDKFDAQATWAFLKYDLNPDVSFTAGRFRQPMYLYSDTYQVGATYPWVTPPVEVYSLIPWYNLNGGMVTLSHPFDGEWKVISKTYYGMAKSKVNFPLGMGDLTAKNVVGEQVAVTNNILTLQASYMHGSYSIKNLNMLGQLDPNHKTNVASTPASMLGLGAKLNYHHFLVLSEIGERKIGDAKGGPSNSQMPAYLGGYTTVGYQYHKWLPTFTAGAIKTTNANKVLGTGHTAGIFNNDSSNPMIASQNSYTAALKYNINNNMDVKGSVERVYTHGGYGFFNGFAPNGDITQPEAAPKKPVMVYQVAYDLMF